MAHTELQRMSVYEGQSSMGLPVSLVTSLMFHVFVLFSFAWLPPSFVSLQQPQTSVLVEELIKPPEPLPEKPPEPETAKPEETQPLKVALAPREPVPRPQNLPAQPQTSVPSTLPPAEELNFADTVINEGPGPGIAVTQNPNPGGTRPGPSGGPASTGPAVVGIGELSRKPIPPSNLDRLLERHYPERAKVEGIEGEAIIRFVLGTNGRILSTRILRQSPSGYDFGRACQSMLRESRWQPGEKAGNPVSTEDDFVCDFSITNGF